MADHALTDGPDLAAYVDASAALAVYLDRTGLPGLRRMVDDGIAYLQAVGALGEVVDDPCDCEPEPESGPKPEPRARARRDRRRRPYDTPLDALDGWMP